MKVIGLTGGIGTGKSTVSEYVIKKGFYVIDADKMAHQITEKGTATLNNIVKEFGNEILDENGCLIRKKLADIVFSDLEKKKALEKLTTRVVLNQISCKVNDLRLSNLYDIIFLDVPLLFETGADKLTDLVWLVDADLETRIERVSERDKVTREHILKRIESQMSTSEKAALSDVIINNSKGKEELYQQVDALLENYAK